MRKLIILITALTAVAVFYLLFFKSKIIETPKYVIIMLFDAARADHFTAYGYSKATTPFIAELAKEGVIFKNAYSQASWTLPSVSSIFTGMYADFHRTLMPNSRLNDEFITIAEYIQSIGYSTSGAYKNRWLVPSKNLNKGFDIWEYTRDRLITDFGIMMLDQMPLTSDSSSRGNYFYPFPSLETRNKKSELLPNPQEVIQDIAEINPDVLLRQRKIEVAASEGVFTPGYYNWGAILRGKYRENSVALYLEGIDEEGRMQSIDTKSKTYANHWASFDYNVRLEKKYKKIILSFKYLRKNPPPDINLSIKRPYFIKNTENNRKKIDKKFVYLHYLSPHEPHISPGIEYDDLFLEKSQERFISDSIGDPNQLNILQSYLPEAKKRFRGWVNLNDDINFHHSNYLRQLRFADDQVKKIVNYLKDSGKYEDTLLILTSDHGEEFLDHGYVSHKMNLYNECIHIPLIMIYPKGLPKGVIIEENVASIDIFPTLVSLFGLEKSGYSKSLKKQMMGEDLLKLINGDNRHFAERTIFSSDIDLSQVAAIYKDIKEIKINSKCYDRSALFELKSDPAELNDSTNSNKQMADRLLSSILRYIKSSEKMNLSPQSKGSTLSDEDKKQLQSLGYLNFDEGPSKKDPYCKYKNLKK